jgi:GNAT superfamily N-acetyltransferase
MLRGWDEGYQIPSFGACVHPSSRGDGLGQWLLEHAIGEARMAGAPKLRLSVYRANQRALHIYRKFGFVFEERNSEELVGWLTLGPAIPPPGNAPLLARANTGSSA